MLRSSIAGRPLRFTSGTSHNVTRTPSFTTPALSFGKCGDSAGAPHAAEQHCGATAPFHFGHESQRDSHALVHQGLMFCNAPVPSVCWGSARARSRSRDSRLRSHLGREYAPSRPLNAVICLSICRRVCGGLRIGFHGVAEGVIVLYACDLEIRRIFTDLPVAIHIPKPDASIPEMI